MQSRIVPNAMNEASKWTLVACEQTAPQINHREGSKIEQESREFEKGPVLHVDHGVFLRKAQALKTWTELLPSGLATSFQDDKPAIGIELA